MTTDVVQQVPTFNTLTEAEQRAVAERLLKIEESGWKPFWCPDPTCSGDPHVLTDASGDALWVDERATTGPHGEPVGAVVEFDDGLRLRPLLDKAWAHNHARADQRLPPWTKPWVLMCLSGRGSGKTRTGVEFITLCARKGVDSAIVGRRGTELENTHVRALIDTAHPEFVPQYLASKDILIWPNGATTFLFSAERPENIRSINVGACWFDEAAHMDEVETAWMNAKLATRIEKPGNPIHFLITSTPTPTRWVMKMEDDPTVEVRRVSTYANRANLSADFIAEMEREYEGTRMGRQELHGEVLRDVEGAMWNDDMFQHLRMETAEQFEAFLETLDDIVVAVDPAGSKGPHSDATGIIAMGVQRGDAGHDLFFVIADGTIKGSPTEWAERAYAVADFVGARRIVVERNFGADMVRQTMEGYAASARDEEDPEYKIEETRAVKGKETRAEPLVGRYEKALVTHVTSPGAFGDLAELEKEQVNWVPKSRGGRSPSPNRIDAEVWAYTTLRSSVKYTTQTATGAAALSKLKRHGR